MADNEASVTAPLIDEKVQPRMRTHRMGNMCATCKAVLVEDRCPCGNAHGYGYQEPNAWAARTWPEHPCFANGTPDGSDDAHA